MENLKIRNKIFALTSLLVLVGCKTPQIVTTESKLQIPNSYNASLDTINSGKISWKNFYKDKNLNELIDIALSNNQELSMVLQEIEIAKK